MTISHLSLIDGADVLNIDSVKQLFVAYNFLGIEPEELETPFSLPKPKADQPITYNFSKSKLNYVPGERNLHFLKNLQSSKSIRVAVPDHETNLFGISIYWMQIFYVHVLYIVKIFLIYSLRSLQNLCVCFVVEPSYSTMFQLYSDWHVSNFQDFVCCWATTTIAARDLLHKEFFSYTCYVPYHMFLCVVAILCTAIVNHWVIYFLLVHVYSINSVPSGHESQLPEETILSRDVVTRWPRWRKVGHFLRCYPCALCWSEDMVHVYLSVPLCIYVPHSWTW